MDIPGWIQFVQLLEWILREINSLVGNPGVAIIIFTILVKLATLPLTMKSIRSGRRMQELAPLLKELQKKYKDDRQKLQVETMRIYSEHGVNPAGSCLPMLVQLPIFLAIWQALSTLVIGSNGNPPDPGFATAFLWVPNLYAADPFFIWPVLSAIFQFLSQRMSLPYGYSKVADPQQAMMNKIMQFMPLYLLVVYINFSAGAVIYWTFSNIFTCVQTYFVNGFGSLPEVPGFTWLPKREMKRITPEIQAELDELNDTRADGRKSRSQVVTSSARTVAATTGASAATAAAPAPEPKGFFGKLMAQAIAAQEAQTAAREQGASSNGTATEKLEPAETVQMSPGTSNGATTRQFVPSEAAINRKRRSKR